MPLISLFYHRKQLHLLYLYSSNSKSWAPSGQRRTDKEKPLRRDCWYSRYRRQRTPVNTQLPGPLGKLLTRTPVDKKAY